MTPSTRKAKAHYHNDHVDRISNLPSNVIDAILEHLPIQDLVRTSILSRKWRYTWTSLPQLKFGIAFFDKFRHLGDVAVTAIITEILMLHNGPLQKFSLLTPIKIKCLDKWVMFLSRIGIKHLEIENVQDEPYQMSSHIFSCEDLTHLRLAHFNVPIPLGRCYFKKMRNLHLYNITFQSNAVDNLISGCPLLNDLTLSFCSGFDSINVSTPNLTVLFIEGAHVIKSICLQKAKKLIDMTFKVYRSNVNAEVGRNNLIKGLPNIERFCLGGDYIKILSAGYAPHRLRRTYNCLTYLKLDNVDFNESREILFIIYFLQNSLNLRELVLTSQSASTGQVVKHLKELECSNCCLNQLRTVDILVRNTCHFQLDLIRFLLINCSVLESLKFEVGHGQKISDKTQLLSISGALLEMERASKNAKVKFNY